MKPPTLLDTGPLVALLNRRDRFHAWAQSQFATIRPPLLTCEAVISEACFLVQSLPGGREAVLGLLERQLVAIAFDLQKEAPAIARLLTRYAELPTALADACLVRMAEQHEGSPVLTLDTDFRIYRIHGRRVVPTLLPPRV